MLACDSFQVSDAVIKKVLDQVDDGIHFGESAKSPMGSPKVLLITTKKCKKIIELKESYRLVAAGPATSCCPTTSAWAGGAGAAPPPPRPTSKPGVGPVTSHPPAWS